MNKQMVPIILFCVIQVYWTGCTGQKVILNPEGDEAKISIRGDIDIVAELLAIVDESILYVNIISGREHLGVSSDETLIGLNLAGVTKIKVQGYTNKNWIVPWVVFQVVPPILLAIAAGSVNSGDALPVFGVFSIPAVISGALMGTGGVGNPNISGRFTFEKITELNKYTRYPLGLNTGQLNQIADSHGQQGYRIL